MKLIYTLLFTLIGGFVLLGQPTSNASDPQMRAEEDVISIYGDTYTSITDVNYNPDWGQAGLQFVDIAFDPGTGNTILAYPNFNYQGTDFDANPQDCSLMEFLHVDIWVAAGTDRLVKISPIDNSGVGPAEFLVDVPLIPGSWNSVDLPKSDFGNMSWNSIFQMKFDGQFNSDGSANTDPFDIYVDNIYFWKEPTVSGTDASLSNIEIDGTDLTGFGAGIFDYRFGLPAGTTSPPQVTLATTTDPDATVDITQAMGVPGTATIVVTSANQQNMSTYTINFFINSPSDSPADPTAAPADVVSIFSDSYTNIDGIDYDPNWGQSGHMLVNPTFDPGTGNPALAYPNFNYQGTDFAGNAQDLSNMEFLHIDIWIPEGLDRLVKVSPIDDSGNGPAEVLVEVPVTPGAWNSVDLPKSSFVDMPWSSIIQLKFDGQFNSDGSANTEPYSIYLDNLYFYKLSTSTTDLESKADIIIYPNPLPMGESLNLSKSVDDIKVISTDGRLLLSSSGSIVNMSEVPAGTFIIRMTSADGEIQLKKLIVIK